MQAKIRDAIKEPVRFGVILDKGLDSERCVFYDMGDDVLFTFWSKDPELGAS